MKGGLVVMLTALKAMKDAGALDKAEIRIVLSGDEENHGQPLSISRKDMIDAAKKSDVALEFVLFVPFRSKFRLYSRNFNQNTL